MARIASAQKLGFYPTPDDTETAILDHLSAAPGARIRLFDPCAGEGKALAAIAQHLRAQHRALPTTYGIELSTLRAPIAANVLDHCLHSDYEAVTISKQASSLLYLNPPYDFEIEQARHARKHRLEFTFLRNTLSRLQLGGVLVYLIPQLMLYQYEIAQFLAAHLDRISVYKLPPKDYKLFRQVVIFGVRRQQQPPDQTIVRQLQDHGRGANETPFLPRKADLPDGVTITPYLIPASTLPDSELVFQPNKLSAADLLALYATQNAFASTPWHDFQSPPTATTFTPVLPLRRNHLGALIASGQIGTVTLTDANGRPFLAKGRSIKTTRVHQQERDKPDATDPDQSADSDAPPPPGQRKTLILTDDYATTIGQFDHAGHYSEITSTGELESFLLKHGPALTQIIDQRYKPLYTEPTPAEWLATEPIVPYKRLPGRSETGLLDAQKHVAIACARSILQQGWVDLIGQMGVGKSIVGMTAVEVLNLTKPAYPVVLTCPGHLVETWRDEIQLGVPGAQATIIKSISDLKRFRTTYRPGSKRVAILSMEAAKNGPGWVNSTLIRYIPMRIPCTDATLTIRTNVQKTAPVPFLKNSLQCTEENLLTDSSDYDENNPDFVSLDGPKDPKNGTQLALVAWHCCPTCGAPIERVYNNNPDPGWDSPRFCSAPRRYWQGDPAGHNSQGQWLQADMQEVSQPRGKSAASPRLVCGAPLFSRSRLRRVSLAKYIKEHMHGFFQTYIADEQHQTKGQSTDAGCAYHQLHMACRYTLNLTGTLFGGVASDLFWMRYRIDPAVRAEYDWHDVQRWCSAYGRIERIVTEVATYSATGTFSGIRRWTQRVDELPGISPMIYQLMLKSCIFLKTSDLGYELPAYTEHIVPISMTPAQRADYTFLYDTLYTHILEGLRWDADDQAREETQKLLGVWLQWCFSRPNSGFREEKVLWKPPSAEKHVPYLLSELIPTPPDATDPTPSYKTVPMLLPALVKDHELLPKEQWLLDLVLSEKAQGRKCLIFVRQTGRRNIQPRLEQIIADAGGRIKTLPDKIAPAKRTDWIRRYESWLDNLLVNPQKVETGMTLIKFPTIIWYEIVYSLFTLWQATFRSWRLGQNQPVQVYYPVYTGTIEREALLLMGTKMRSALMLYGDNASSALSTQDSGSSDIMTELTRRILSGQTLHSDGITTILQNAIGQQNSPGSPLPSWLSAVQIAKNTQNTTPNLTSTTAPDPYTMTVLANQIPTQPAQIDAGQLSFFQYLAG